MKTPTLDEVRRALDTLTAFVQSFDAFLSPVVARAEGARPVAASQEPRDRPSDVHGRRGPKATIQIAVLEAMRAFGRPVYMREVVQAINRTRGDGQASASLRTGIVAAMVTLADRGILKRDTVAKLWSLQANIVLDSPVTVPKDDADTSH